jgi:ChpA-C
MSSSVLRRMLVAAVSSSVIAVCVAVVPASAQTTQQSGLVNVALTGNTVQVPVAVAADICGVQANVIATNTFGGNAICTSTSSSTANGGGGGGGTTTQEGLVNVALTGNTVQVPVGVAADVCGVAVNVIASGTFGGNALCSTISQPGATA